MRLPVVVIAAFVCLSVPATARDWKKYPAVVQVDRVDEIYAIGDAHSDFKRLARAMAAAGIIAAPVDNPADAQWRAGHAVLVTTGDMIDKGPRALDVLRLMQVVRGEARRAGGDVIVLAGNHEAEFLADPSASKGKEFAAQLKAASVEPAEVGQCKGEFGEFLCSLAFAARVDDWFFAHGGNSSGRTVEKLMSDLEAGVERDGYATKELIGDDSILESRLNGEGRSVWIDAGLPARGERQLLKEYARALGVSHIVEGHVPSPVVFADGMKRERGEIFQRFGLLFLIDTGMSEGVDDSGGAVLHITKSGATAVCPDGARTLLWDTKNLQDAGRAKPCPK